VKKPNTDGSQAGSLAPLESSAAAALDPQDTMDDLGKARTDNQHTRPGKAPESILAKLPSSFFSTPGLTLSFGPERGYRQGKAAVVATSISF
jgi:hypothetical protein